MILRDDKKSHGRPDPAARIMPSRASDQALHGCMHADEALAPASPLLNMRSIDCNSVAALTSTAAAYGPGQRGFATCRRKAGNPC